MIECMTCKVVFHKLIPMETGKVYTTGEREFVCPFCKQEFVAAPQEMRSEQGAAQFGR